MNNFEQVLLRDDLDVRKICSMKLFLFVYGILIQ